MKSDAIVLRCVLVTHENPFPLHVLYQRKRIELPGVKEAMNEKINLLDRNDEPRIEDAVLLQK